MRQPRGLWECPICDATELRDGGEDPPICEACRDSGGPIVGMRARGPERETIVTDGGDAQCTSDSERSHLVVAIERLHGASVWVYDDGNARVVPEWTGRSFHAATEQSGGPQ